MREDDSEKKDCLDKNAIEDGCIMCVSKPSVTESGYMAVFKEMPYRCKTSLF